MATSPKPTLVLIHGLWMTPHSWRDWIAHFERKGYVVLAPGWPGVENRSVADINDDPSALKGLKIHEIVDRYEEVIRKLDKPPIIMGHSFGGLFAQLLVNRGLGCAGIAINSASPAGVNALTLSVIKSIFPVLSPFNYDGVVPLSLQQFHYIFTNELDDAESKRVYHQDHIPGAAHILWQGALAGLHNSGDAEVNWKKKDRAPLLLTAGAKDHIVPVAVAKAVVEKYKSGPAIVEYKEFEDRTHHIVGQTGWEEVADYCLSWAEEHRST
jgi:non-heme chloroperoxidase